jgi:hypothetical protein
MLFEAPDALHLLVDMTRGVDQHHGVAGLPRGALEALRQRRVIGVVEVGKHQAQRHALAGAHRLRRAVRAVAELLRHFAHPGAHFPRRSCRRR